MTLIVMGSKSDKDSAERGEGGDFDERMKDLIPNRITRMIIFKTTLVYGRE